MNTTQITRLPERIEIAFWSMLISLMKETLRIRIKLPNFSGCWVVIEHSLFIARVILMAASGLVLGLALGYMVRFAL